MENFPESPYIGQTFEYRNDNWKWNGVGWCKMGSTLESFDASEFNKIFNKLENVSEFNDNTAALSGGLSIGDIYRTGDLLKIVH